jgi:hypothetical protein
MRFLVPLLTVLVSLAAAGYHGQVTFGGLPLPGVSITATQDDRTFATSTDERGHSFENRAMGAIVAHFRAGTTDVQSNE